jgi:hypothetical protein
MRGKALQALIAGVCLCLGIAAAALAQGADNSTRVFDVTPTSAQVTAVINPPGQGGNYRFEWGTDDRFEFHSMPVALGIEQGTREVGGTITGLTPATTYLVRVRITGRGGPVTGPSTAFATLSQPLPTTPQATVPAPAPALQPRVTAESTPHPDEAEQGEAVVLAAESGTVAVKQAGTNEYATLVGGATVPVGSLVDARNGTVRLVTEAGAATQEALVRDGKFQVRQSSHGSGTTDLVLRGGDFSSCRRARSAGGSDRRRPRRSLWAHDRRGRFRTRGLNSVATVRGTTWRTTDTCRGTTTSVLTGSVVVRERRSGRTAIVRKGQRYLAPYRR